MSIRSLLLTAGLIAALPVTAEVTAIVTTGSDDNPHRLGDAFSPAADLFAHTRINAIANDGDRWRIRATLDNHTYLDDENAGQTTLRIDGRFKLPFSGERLEVFPLADFRLSDRTYVSRITGQRYQVSGVDASDRYDYRRFDAGAEIRFAATDTHRLRLRLISRQQDYDEVAVTTIDSLDYDQQAVTLYWDYRPNRKIRFSPFVSYRTRNYDSRRAIDESGNRLNNETLDYTYLVGGLSARVYTSATWRVWLSANLEQRDDSNDYYDATVASLQARARYQFARHHYLDARLSYRNFDYDREPVTNIEDDDEVPDFDGWRLQVTYNQPVFKLGEHTVDWRTSLAWHNYDSPVQNYAYDRLKAETGFAIRF